MKVRFSREFAKRRDKAPAKIQKALESRLELFFLFPFHPLLNNHSLKGPYRNLRSINISGDWRALYEEKGDDEYYFVLFGTHSELYG